MMMGERCGTTGPVTWTVRIEYELLNKSKFNDGTHMFTMTFTVAARSIEEAWREAMEHFNVELEFDERTYGRVEMSVRIAD